MNKCPRCGKTYATNINKTITCCQYPLRIKATASTAKLRRTTSHVSKSLLICETCDHFVKKGCGTGCDLHPIRPCKLVPHLLSGEGCLDTKSPKFGPVSGRSGIGFLASCYSPIGGVETWHQTLLPHLDNVVGLCSLKEDNLGTPTNFTLTSGLQAAKELAAKCEVLVVWGIGRSLLDIVGKDRPKVISVSHSDSTSDWTTSMMREQEPITDQSVYINPSGKTTIPLPLQKEAKLIPNAPDPKRIVVTNPNLKEELGLTNYKVGLTLTRISAEKRLEVLVEAYNQLPENHRLIICGQTNHWSHKYDMQIRELADHKTIFLDAVEHPGDILNACDILLSASTYEGYGISMAEGILAEKPLVATPVGLLATEPHLARIVPLGASASKWKEEILLSYLGNSATIRAKKARQWILKNNSVEQFVKEWSDLFQSMTSP